MSNGLIATLKQFIDIMISGITDIAKGIGEGLVTLIQYIFLDVTVSEQGAVTVNGLNVFGGVIALFAGISLAIGLCRWVTSFVTSLGAFN